MTKILEFIGLIFFFVLGVCILIYWVRKSIEEERKKIDIPKEKQPERPIYSILRKATIGTVVIILLILIYSVLAVTLYFGQRPDQ